ncbi:hypothetical protein OC844_005984 [Tilletia horrida]|nr:hypothetical protein OC844_005984 [Tilletia horrida]
MQSLLRLSWLAAAALLVTAVTGAPLPTRTAAFDPPNVGLPGTEFFVFDPSFSQPIGPGLVKRAQHGSGQMQPDDDEHRTESPRHMPEIHPLFGWAHDGGIWWPRRDEQQQQQQQQQQKKKRDLISDIIHPPSEYPASSFAWGPSGKGASWPRQIVLNAIRALAASAPPAPDDDAAVDEDGEARSRRRRRRRRRRAGQEEHESGSSALPLLVRAAGSFKRALGVPLFNFGWIAAGQGPSWPMSTATATAAEQKRDTTHTPTPARASENHVRRSLDPHAIPGPSTAPSWRQSEKDTTRIHLLLLQRRASDHQTVPVGTLGHQPPIEPISTFPWQPNGNGNGANWPRCRNKEDCA